MTALIRLIEKRGVTKRTNEQLTYIGKKDQYNKFPIAMRETIEPS